MQPQYTSFCNVTLIGRAGVKDLPACYSDGVIYTYWTTTWRERLQILFGGTVRLAVLGTAHPPVAIDTDRP